MYEYSKRLVSSLTSKIWNSDTVTTSNIPSGGGGVHIDTTESLPETQSQSEPQSQPQPPTTTTSVTAVVSSFFSPQVGLGGRKRPRRTSLWGSHTTDPRTPRLRNHDFRYDNEDHDDHDDEAVDNSGDAMTRKRRKTTRGLNDNDRHEHEDEHEDEDVRIRGRRRRIHQLRLKDGNGNATPTNDEEEDKECDCDCECVPAAVDVEAAPSEEEHSSTTSSSESFSLLLEQIPQDVLQTHIASYLTNVKDHYALQLTCRKLYEVSNTTHSLSKVSLWTDTAETTQKDGHDKNETQTGGENTAAGLGVTVTMGARTSERVKNSVISRCILNGIDVPEVAIEKLYKYAIAGNQQALYMIGMIAAYCYGDKVGVTILRQNASRGCLRSSYTLSLILRDCNKEEADAYLSKAVEVDYLPACQELLTSQQVKEKFGDLDYKSLQHFFDPIALNRLLGRTYLQSSGVRGVSTSHCWNPNCGRWALKATTAGTRGPQLQFSSKYLPPLPPHLEACLLKLVEDHNRSQARGHRQRPGMDLLGQGICMEVNVNSANTNTCEHLNVDSFNTVDLSVGVDADMDFSTSRRVPRSPSERSFRVSRMKMCSSCRRAKYCSKLCQVYDWRSGQHKMECQYLWTG